jgi:hypothetical protein
MNDSWHLIRGVCLYRPASNALFEAVLSGAKQSLRELDRSWRAPKDLLRTKAELQTQIEESERELASLARHVARVRDRGGDEEALVWEQMGSECNRLCEERRAQAAEIERELETWFAPLRQAHQRDQRRWVRRLMLASGDDRQACLAHLGRLHGELVEERLRELQATADLRIERAADEALAVMRRSMGLKDRAPEPDDPWGWNRHRRRGGGGWNCA